MHLLLFLALSRPVAAASPVSLMDRQVLLGRTATAFEHALAVLPSQHARAFLLKRELPDEDGAHGADIFKSAAGLTPVEVAQIFIEAALRDPHLALLLIAGDDDREGRRQFSRRVFERFVQNEKDFELILFSLNRAEVERMKHAPADPAFGWDAFVRFNENISEHLHEALQTLNTESARRLRSRFDGQRRKLYPRLRDRLTATFNRTIRSRNCTSEVEDI